MNPPNGDGPSATAWPRDRWLDALWDCETLKPRERAVAYVYARYAGSKSTSWCSWDELIRRTSIRSRTTISDAIAGLVEGGWLVEVEPARQHYSARYALEVPKAQQSKKWTADTPADDPPSSPDFDASSPKSDLSSPKSVPDLSNGLLQRTAQKEIGGDARPRTPQRTESPSAPRADRAPEPDQSQTTRTKVDRESPVPSAAECALPALDLAADPDALDATELAQLVKVLKARDVEGFGNVRSRARQALGFPVTTSNPKQRETLNRAIYRAYRAGEAVPSA
jgi:hypothetical protein